MVHQGILKLGNKDLIVACKEMLPGVAFCSPKETVEEAKRMIPLVHRNVIALIGIAFADEGRPIIVVEFAGNGSLHNYLRNEDNVILVYKLSLIRF